MTPESALATIRQIVAQHVKGVRFEDDTPLISGGILDSMTIVDLIMDLEKAFGVIIPASEVDPSDFDSVRDTAATVKRFT